MKRILAAILLLLMFACAPAVTPQDFEDKTVNKTAEKEVKGAQTGDLATINYVLRMENGSVVSTNDPELAKEHGLKNYIKGPYRFIMGQSGIVPGFDTVIVGMEEGDHREAIIEPSEPEVVVPLNRTMIQERFLRVPRYQKFPVRTYKTFFGKEPFIGDVVYNETLQFKYQVENMTNTSVLAKIQAKEGEEYQLKNHEWDSQVLRVAKQDILFGQMPEDNQTITTPFGTAQVYVSKSRLFIRHNPVVGQLFNRSVKIQGDFAVDQVFRVTEVGEDYFVIKRHGLLADKRLELSVDMLNITKQVKTIDKSTPTPFVSVSSGVES